MPIFRQGSVGNVMVAAVPPLAGTRAGTTNPAGGLSAEIDARGYKNGTLIVFAGVVTASTGAVTGKMQSAATAGGAQSDISGAAIAGFGPSDDNTVQSVDFEIPAGRPFLKAVVTAVEATDVSSAIVILRGPTRS